MGEKGNLTGSFPGSDQSKLPNVPKFGTGGPTDGDWNKGPGGQPPGDWNKPAEPASWDKGPSPTGGDWAKPGDSTQIGQSLSLIHI